MKAAIDKKLTLRIAALRKAVKRKYRLFKDGNIENEKFLERQYKPIIQELRKTNIPDIKTEPVDTVKYEPIKDEKESMEIKYDTSDDEGDFTPMVVSTPRATSLSRLVSTPSDIASTTQFIESYFKNPITAEYMKLFIKDSAEKKIIDYVFGPRYVEGDMLMIGDKTLDFDDDGNIKIGGTNYGSSEGLYELIFKKVPDSTLYNDRDLNAYKSILINTNAHREKYKFNGRIKASKGTKYTKIIKDLISTRGKGVAWKRLKTRDIIYWDDVNELVERLKHLVYSTETGNRVHGNEILNIVEELREAGFIKGGGNSRFKALLQ
jgi:hypothetical protein